MYIPFFKIEEINVFFFGWNVDYICQKKEKKKLKLNKHTHTHKKIK